MTKSLSLSLLLVCCVSLASLSAKDQWSLSKEEQGIRVFVKNIKSEIKTFKGIVTLSSRLTPLVAVLECQCHGL